MKTKLLITILLAVVLAEVAHAQYYSDRKHDEGTDTLMVYNSWQSVFYTGPDTMAINPNIEISSPFQYKFKPTEKDRKPLSKMIEKQSVAVAIGDSVWLVNSKYLKDSLQGGYNKYFRDYLPLYFSEKIVFFQYLPTEIEYLDVEIDNFENLQYYVGVGRSSLLEYPGGVADVAHFVIDLENKTVFLVDKNYLLYLLERYPDMKRRFEMMAGQNEFYLINEFFWDYVDRISRDPYAPNIVQP
ncbi:MAG: hypothetical protein J6X22_01180 [Muribaculaceae bacterium]|nr:hypothetical protein [Muribaculaceae bacterium]